MLIIQRPAVEAARRRRRQPPAFCHRATGARLRPYPRRVAAPHAAFVDPGRGGHPGPLRRCAARVHHSAGREGRHHRHHLELQGHCPSGRNVRAGDAPPRLEGPGTVTAGDIQTTADVEVLNTDLALATLNAKGRLACDITVERGRGYVAAERNKRSSTIGIIPVDSIFSPIRLVSFSVEPARVEQSTNYDRLVLDITTDGSITPREALASAGSTLRSLMGLVADMSESPQGLVLGEVVGAGSGSPDLDLPIEELDLSERPRNCLKRAQINTCRGTCVQDGGRPAGYYQLRAKVPGRGTAKTRRARPLAPRYASAIGEPEVWPLSQVVQRRAAVSAATPRTRRP